MKTKKTKTVLIITSRSEKTVSWQKRKQYVEQFCEEVGQRLDNVRVIYTTYQDMRYVISGGKTSITDTLNDMDIADVDFVHFRNWQYEKGEATAAALYLDSLKIPYINREAGSSVATGKLAQTFVFAQNKLPVPDTFHTSREGLIKIFSDNELPKGFVYPLIMKADEGARGNDNHLINDSKEAIKILKNDQPDKRYVLQNFIPNDGDYRFLFIGLKNPPIVFHRQGASGNHLNNTSQGGRGRIINPADLPDKYLRYALKAAGLFEREVSGVDILVDKQTKKPYLLEVNATPAIATGYSTDTKVEHFVSFLQDKLNNEKKI